MTCSNFCAILQCRRIHKAAWDKEHGITYFVVPKNSFEKWKDIVPNLKKGARLCTRHFDESDIIKGSLMGSVFHEYLRWQLKKGAYPKRFLLDSDYPEERRTTQQKKTILRDITLYGNGQNNSTAVKKLSYGMKNLLNRDQAAAVCPAGTPEPLAAVHMDLDVAQLNNAITAKEFAAQASRQAFTPVPLDTPSSCIPLAPNDSIDVASLVPSNCDHDYALGIARPTVRAEKDRNVMADTDHSYGIRPSSSTPTIEEACLDLDFVGYRDFISDVRFPTAEWCWSFNERKKHLMCSCPCISDEGVMTIKTVRVLSKTKVQLFINGKPIYPPDLNLELQTKADLSNIVQDFHYRNICKGIVEEALADSQVTERCAGTKEGNAWRSKGCLGLTCTGVVCSNCRFLRKYLKRMKKREPKKPKDLKERYKQKLKTSQRALKRMKSKMEKFSATIAELRKERRKLISNLVDAKIKILNPKEQLVVKTMMAKAKVNPGRDDKLTAMRYDPEFLADCLLIKQKSSAVYKHLRSKGILPLPSEATLLRTAKKMNLEGLNFEQAGQTHHFNQPHQNQDALDSDESNPSDIDQSEDLENERSGSPDFTVALSPEIVLPEAEEMVVEIYSVE